MINPELEVEVRIFTKTLELLFIQCEIEYENIEYKNNEIIVITKDGELRYTKDTSKQTIALEALKMGCAV